MVRVRASNIVALGDEVKLLTSFTQLCTMLSSQCQQLIVCFLAVLLLQGVNYCNTSEQRSDGTLPLLVLNRNWQISSNEKIGAKVTTVQVAATDDEHFTFGLEHSEQFSTFPGPVPFTINEEGVVTVNSSLEEYAGGQYFLYVIVSSGQIPSKAEVNVHILRPGEKRNSSIRPGHGGHGSGFPEPPRAIPTTPRRKSTTSAATTTTSSTSTTTSEPFTPRNFTETLSNNTSHESVEDTTIIYNLTEDTTSTNAYKPTIRTRHREIKYELNAPGLGVATWKEISLVNNEVHGYSERNSPNHSTITLISKYIMWFCVFLHICRVVIQG